MTQTNHIPLKTQENTQHAAVTPANAVVTQAEDSAVGFGTASGFALMQRAATLLSSSSLVPKDFQKNLPNCVIALNMANRIGADPLMVMQNLYVVHGRPSWSSQFLIATFNQSGRFSSLRFEFFGEKGKDTYGCRAWAVEKSTGEKLLGSDITIALAKAEGWYGKTGSKWKTMEQQMLMYRAASWFVRAYAPELAMGLHTQDEMEDIGPGSYDAADTQGKTLDLSAVSVPEAETAPEKKDLETFKKKNAEKPVEPQKQEESIEPGKCQSCEGHGTRVWHEGTESGIGPCDACEGTGAVK